MNILHVASGLPSPETPFYQPFIKSQIDSLVRAGLNLYVLDIKGYESLSNYITYSKRIKVLAREKNIDLIHAHYGYCGVTALLAQTKLPIVLSLMGSDLLGSPNEKGSITFRGKFDRALTKFVARKVDRIIVKSQDMKSKVRLNLNIDVIPNGVNFSLFKPADKRELRQKLELNNDSFIILFLGNTKLNRKNFKLAKEAYDYFINNNKISNAQLITPFGIPQSKVIEYMNAADVLLLTSYWEGSPNVIKESMACNLPIISVDVGDVKEVIQNSFNCFLVDYSAQQISEKLLIIYNNKLPSNGRTKINHLSDDEIARKIIRIYTELLNTNSKLRK